MPGTPDTPAQTLLGFDFGTAQIGVAVGQTVTASTRGLCVLKAHDGRPDWTQITTLVTEWQPSMLLVGLPLNMDGSESEFCRRCRKFARRLTARTGLKVVMVDERLSTAIAKSEHWQTPRTQHNKPMSGKRGNSRLRRAANHNYRDNPIDAEAAALIMQTWLNEPECGLEP